MDPVAILQPAFALTAIWLAELVGIPVAWLRLRGTDAWHERAAGVGRIRLLRESIGVYTGLSAVLGGIVGLCMWLGTVFAMKRRARQEIPIATWIAWGVLTGVAAP